MKRTNQAPFTACLSGFLCPHDADTRPEARAHPFTAVTWPSMREAEPAIQILGSYVAQGAQPQIDATTPWSKIVEKENGIPVVPT